MNLDLLVSTSQGQMTVAQMRTEFLILDALAYRRGGLKKLTSNEQYLYVELAQRTGILSVETIEEVKRELGFNDLPDWPEAEPNDNK